MPSTCPGKSRLSAYRCLISDLSIRILRSVALRMTFVEQNRVGFPVVDLLKKMMLDVMENATLEDFGDKGKQREFSR